VRIGPDLALVHHAVLVRVQVLDRILDGDDVLVPLGVDLVDDRRERGRLARAGRPGDEHQPARLLRQLADDRGQAQFLERKNLERNRTKCRRHRAALHEQVGAKTREAFDAEREVELVLFLELVLLRVGEDRVAELLGLHRRERRRLQRHEPPVDAQLRRRAGGDVKVGRSLLDHRFEQLVKIRHLKPGLFIENL
jgi:hypothetical protein